VNWRLPATRVEFSHPHTVTMSTEDTLQKKFGKEVPRGTVLFREGDRGNEMYVIQSGKVAISKRVGDAEKTVIVLGAGEFFGEMAIISRRPRNASATVDEDAQLLVIDMKLFETMVRSNAEIAFRMIKRLADRLADADARIESLMLGDPQTRVVSHLLQQCQNKSRPVEDGIEIDCEFKSVAAHLGLTEATVRQTLTRLQAFGLVTVDEPRAVVSDSQRLYECLQYFEMKWKFGDL
jgi:CRP/FNR family transcriptional regulator, cyclic AMP receptor protein